MVDLVGQSMIISTVESTGPTNGCKETGSPGQQTWLGLICLVWLIWFGLVDLVGQSLIITWLNTQQWNVSEETGSPRQQPALLQSGEDLAVLP